MATFVALLSFALQTLVLQTHIHGGALSKAPSATFSGINENGPNQRPDTHPANVPATKCSICQALLHVGLFVTPSGATLQASAISAFLTAIASKLPAAVPAPSHIWQSRGPPRA